MTVRLTETVTNAFNEPVERVTDIPTWASLVQDRVARSIEAGGVYAEAERTWRVRYDARIVEAHEAGGTIAVVYGEGDPDIVTDVGEPARADRRRFLHLLT